VKEVSLELSKSTDQKVVMWVLDSFSTLVSNALNPHESKVAYAGMISMLFDLNTSIIPIAVCSSATTGGALSESMLSQSFLCEYVPFHFNFNLSLI
jgi:hypothetical protein